jgi:hypothetical protein
VYKPQSFPLPPSLALLLTMLKILQPDPHNWVLISTPLDCLTPRTTVEHTLFKKIRLNFAAGLSGYVL